MDQSIQVALGIDGTLGVALLGEIDFTNSTSVANTVRAWVEREHPGTVRVDMAGVTFLDSSGIGVLVIAYKAATATGATYQVVGSNPAVYEQLRLTGLVDLFGIEPPRVPVS